VNMDVGMYQEQTQKLVMTQQMKQAIQLLQCTSEELNEYLLSEVINNPLVEYQPPSVLREALWSTGRRQRSRERGMGFSSRSQGNPVEQVARTELGMADELEQQLTLMNAPREDIDAAVRLLGCLDESGYLDCTEEERIAVCGSFQRYRAALELVQQCDPVGIGATSLKDCLLLQANLLEEPLRLVVRLVLEHHLEDVAAGKLQWTAKCLGKPVTEIQAAVDAIRAMNPRPGANLGVNRAQYVVPEVLVARVGNEYQVMLNDDTQPKVSLNRNYVQLWGSREGSAYRYLNQHLQSAQWLMKALEQRRQTLYRVSSEIVRVQQRFFDEGPSGLQPLTLQQVATEVQLHESTVSRAVRGKFMQTPRGVYELKYFFSAELSTRLGSVSSESVKYLIRQMVEGEDASQPLSDESLSRELMGRGIQVSRRTVAKYRDEMHIPTSAQRRRFA